MEALTLALRKPDGRVAYAVRVRRRDESPSPRAAEGLDESDGSDVLLGEDLGVAEFDEQAGALGVEKLDLADEPAVVALSDEVLGLAGRGEGFAEGG